MWLFNQNGMKSFLLILFFTAVLCSANERKISNLIWNFHWNDSHFDPYKLKSNFGDVADDSGSKADVDSQEDTA